MTASSATALPSRLWGGEGYQDLGTVTIEDGTFKSAESVDAVKAYAFNNAK